MGQPPAERDFKKLITWDHHTNCITNWTVPGWSQPISFTGWGCEVGNWFGFFAHEKPGGLACQIKDVKLEPTSPTEISSSWWIRLPKANFHIQNFDEISSTSIFRTLTLCNPSNSISWLGDAVIRLAVPWEQGLVAEQAGKIISHKNSNFYYDTEDSEMSLNWANGHRLTVNFLDQQNVPLPLTPYLYVRDQPALPGYEMHPLWGKPTWIIHARLLVDYPAALMYRLWRNPFVLWSRSRLGRFLLPTKHLGKLWRAGEWGVHKRCSLFGLWPMLPDQTMSFSIKITAS